MNRVAWGSDTAMEVIQPTTLGCYSQEITGLDTCELWLALRLVDVDFC